ncbi:hypothetical protein TWF718_010562 [Orbilia javanica]|uniref:Uncharacterized protein n=1 Tax=Orbilia javanica TaxID=47235 RepID=A0AAN8NPV8_9PEZI
MEYSSKEDTPRSTLTIRIASSPSLIPLKGPKSAITASTPTKRKRSSPVLSELSKLSTTTTSYKEHKMAKIAIFNIHKYNDLSRKKLQTFRTLGSLKSYVTGEFLRLQVSFREEIAKVKATGIPLAQEITFSNVDDYIVDAVAGFNDGKQTLTHLRDVVVMHSRTIFQIAQDLQEEIRFVMASAQGNSSEDEEDGAEGFLLVL